MDPEEVKRQLERICSSPPFRAAGRVREFLAFIVEQTLAGNEQHIKEYTIATDVYARSPSFDPKIDSIVRVEAARLRTRLGEYYERHGRSDELEICVPKGGYVPTFYKPQPAAINGTARNHQISELCDTAFAALMRSTPASLDVAAACLIEARSLNPSDARPHVGLATCHGFALSSEARPPAAATLELRLSAARASRLRMDSADVHIAASVCHFFADRVEQKASDEARRALELEPRNAIAHFWVPALLSAAGNHEASLTHMGEAMRQAPENPLYPLYLGRVLYWAGRNAEAVQVLKRVAQVDPNLAVVYLWTALAHTEIAHHDEAIEAASHAVCLSETSATLGAYAYVLARAGRRDDAECIFERLCVNPPYGYASPVHLAVIAEALGRHQEAASHMDRAHRESAWGLLWQDVDPRLQRIQSRRR